MDSWIADHMSPLTLVSYTITPALVHQYHPEWTRNQSEAWLKTNKEYLEDELMFRVYSLCTNTSGPWHKLRKDT